MKTEAPKKILIVLHGAIGDVVRGLSLAVRIKKTWPDVHLAWAVEPISYPLVSSHPAIDKVHLFDRPKGISAYIRFARELRKEKFDLVLDLQRHVKSGFTSFITGAKRRIGFHRKNAKECNWLFNSEYIEPVENFSQKIWHYHSFGDKLGLVDTKPFEFGFLFSDEVRERVENILVTAATEEGISLIPKEKRVLLIVGSTWKSRFWKLEHFAHVAKELHRRYGYCCLIVGGKGEKEFSEKLFTLLPKHSALNLVGKTSLFELAALCKEVSFAIACDSGPMHIAAAVGIPVISLWGSTSPKRSAPYANEHLVLQSPIGCSPCYKRDCPGLGTVCMSDIPPQAVLQLAQSLISTGS